MTAEPPDVQANLPAAYQNPWGLLGRDLQAVVADLGLQLRALWRRNRQGELSVPGFWPGPLQALFWPLLLALLLALPWIGWRLLPHRPGPSEPGLTKQAPAPGIRGPERPGQRPPAAVERPRAPEPRISSSADGSQTVDPEPGAAAGDSTGVAGPAPAIPLEPPPPQLALDPLMEMLAEADPQQLIVSAHPEPALSLLRLTLASAYGDLSPASRLDWANHWSEQARNLGYERFELVDGQQRLLGREALVGSGMILLDPTPRL